MGSQPASHMVSPISPQQVMKGWNNGTKMRDHWSLRFVHPENILSHLDVWSKHLETNRKIQDYKQQGWTSRYHSCGCYDYGHLGCLLCPEDGHNASQLLHHTSNRGTFQRPNIHPGSTYTSPDGFVILSPPSTMGPTDLHISTCLAPFGILLWQINHSSLRHHVASNYRETPTQRHSIMSQKTRSYTKLTWKPQTSQCTYES
jgi:hypothetical protein